MQLYGFLNDLGGGRNLNGYWYVADLIVLQSKEGRDLLPLKYGGYAYLSQKYGKSIGAIEKDIGNFIDHLWLRGDAEILYKIFGETVSAAKGTPSNKQFIMTLIEYFKHTLHVI